MRCFLVQAALHRADVWHPVSSDDALLLTELSAQDVVQRSGLTPRSIHKAVAFDLHQFSVALPSAIRAADRTDPTGAASVLRRLNTLCASGLCLAATDLIFFPK